MQKPVQIVFRNMSASPALEQLIHEKIAKLEHLSDRIIGCHVAIEAEQGHPQSKLFHVHIDLTVPGQELVVSRDTQKHSHEDAYTAVREAFAALTRQLRSYARPHHREGCDCAPA